MGRNFSNKLRDGWEFQGNDSMALMGVAQFVGHCPKNQKVIGWIPGQGTCLSCGLGPGQGVWERQLIDVSLPLILPPSPLSEKINKIFFKNKKIIVYTKTLRLELLWATGRK